MSSKAPRRRSSSPDLDLTVLKATGPKRKKVTRRLDPEQEQTIEDFLLLQKVAGRRWVNASLLERAAMWYMWTHDDEDIVNLMRDQFTREQGFSPVDRAALTTRRRA
jgi:hypothetical protein